MKTFIVDKWETSETVLPGDVIVRHTDDTFHNLRIEEELRVGHWNGVDAQMAAKGYPTPPIANGAFCSERKMNEKR